MCQISLCLQSKWTPALQPAYRPPQGGWPLRELPETIGEPIRQAWKARRKQEVRNSQEAILEAAKFLEMQQVEITKELVAELRQQADWQYCTDEPSRCSRGALIARASAAPAVTDKAQTVTTNSSALAPVRKAKAPAPTARRAPAKRRGCCGR